MAPIPFQPDAGQNQAEQSGSRAVVTLKDRRFWLPLVLIFLALIATILGTGYGYYRWQRDRFIQMAHDQLTAIVEAKSADLDRWCQERTAQVRLMANMPLTVTRFRQVLADPTDATARQDVATWLMSLVDEHSFSSIALFDGQGELRLMIPAASSERDCLAEHAAAALKTRTLAFNDFHRSPNGVTRLAFTAPVRLQNDTDLPPDGVLVLHIDPADYLYPFIQRWPTLSPTAETLLVRREGDEVVYLNELRHQVGTALKLRIPLKAASQLPAALAVLGRKDVTEGLDYRGTPVLTAFRTVPGTPWSMVAKVDQDEIYEPLRVQARSVAAITAAIILAAGLGVGWFWYMNNAEFLRRRREADQERKTLAGRLRFLNQQANDILILVDPRGRIIEANNRALEAYGYTLEELSKRTLFELCAPETTGEFVQVSSALSSGTGAVFEGTHQRKDGSTFPVETSMRTFTMEGHSYQQHIIRDITKRRKMERELAEAHSFLENLFDSANSLIVVTGPDRIVTRFNHAAEQLTGYAAAEVVGQDLALLFPPAKRDSARMKIAASSDLERPEPVEIPILRKDGQTRLILWSSARLFGGELRKKPLGTISQGQDITERKRMEAALRQSEEQFRALAKTSPVGIFRANSQGQVDYWNERLDSLTGMTVDEIRGQSWTQAVHPDDRQRVADEWDRCAHDQAVFKLQFRMVHQRGTVTWAVGEAMAMMDPSGRVTGYVGTITDIGDLKQAEEHLRATLEDLTRSNRDLEQFAYVASHDLQEPLRMVSSYTQLLAERYQNQLDQDANDFIAFAVDGAKRMQRLINDLLAYSRIGRRSSAPVRLDSSAVCQQALINLAPAIAESGAVVTCDPLPTVVADEILLIQVFQNLIGNAVKFRRPDTPPRVHVGYRREGAEWVFSVRDNGIGIAPEYFSRLFVIFQRLHAKGEYPGTGIGLAICKRIVERHGGRIWLESAPGQGATFLFSFPAV